MGSPTGSVGNIDYVTIYITFCVNQSKDFVVQQAANQPFPLTGLVALRTMQAIRWTNI